MSNFEKETELNRLNNLIEKYEDVYRMVDDALMADV